MNNNPVIRDVTKTFPLIFITINALALGYWQHSALAGVFMFTLPIVVCYCGINVAKNVKAMR
jgi:hypothetical protein